MPIIYALVAHGVQVLAEFTSVGLRGNFPAVTRILLEKINPLEDTKMSYIYDNYIFHYIVTNEITFMCMADSEFGRVQPFNYLENIKTRFFTTYGDQGKTAIAFAFNADFSPVLMTTLNQINQPDKVSQVKSEINSVKQVMIENIDKVLKRGEKIELLVDKTTSLSLQSDRFKKSSKQLKNVMWTKKMKMYALAVIILALLIYLILVVSCGGFRLPNC